MMIHVMLWMHLRKEVIKREEEKKIPIYWSLTCQISPEMDSCKGVNSVKV